MVMKPDLTRLCLTIANDLTLFDFDRIKYLLCDIISPKPLEDCLNITDVFTMLYQMGVMNDSKIGIIFQILQTLELRMMIKRIRDSDFYHNHPGCESFADESRKISDRRILLYSIAIKLGREEVDRLKFMCCDVLNAQMRESTSIWYIFRCLEQKGVMAEIQKGYGLCEKLELIGRMDLVEELVAKSSNTVSTHKLADDDDEPTDEDLPMESEEPNTADPPHSSIDEMDTNQPHRSHGLYPVKQPNKPSAGLTSKLVTIPIEPGDQKDARAALHSALKRNMPNIPEFANVSTSTVEPLITTQNVGETSLAPDTVQASMRRQSPVEASPIQPSTQEIASPKIHSPWKSTHMGHRLAVYKYDDITNMCNNFRNIISEEGGFGVVYKGVLKLDKERCIEVAVKRMKLVFGGDQGDVEFKREKCVASVRHPFIVPVLGASDEPDKPMCIIYPFMEGGDLESAINSRNPKLTWKKSLSIITQVSSALLYLHTDSPDRPCIVHLDVKPANILLDQYFNARLGDTGLSREINPGMSRRSMTAMHPGTLGYQDPSMIEDWEHRPTNDVFSLSIVMLRLLTGEPAFYDRKPLHVHLNKEKCFKNCKKLMEKVNIDMWPTGNNPDVLLTERFANLIISCIKRDSEERIDMQKLHDSVKDLTKQAESNFETCLYEESGPNNHCVICYTQLRVAGLSLRSDGCNQKCDRVCLQCLIDSPQNPLVCPVHGLAEPPIGHSQSYGLFIGTNDIKNSVNFHKDASSVYKEFTNPHVGAIKKENAVLMTNKGDTHLQLTAKNILHQLQDFSKKMENQFETSFLFYFSGHSSNSGEGLVCNGGDDLEVSELRKCLYKMKCTQLLIILDCCFAADRGPMPSNLLFSKSVDADCENDQEMKECGVPILYKFDTGDDSVVKAKNANSASKSANYSVVQWSASKGHEESIGYRNRKLSLFTQHIVAGLRAAEKCHLNPYESQVCHECSNYRDKVMRQGYITLNDLADYVFYHVKEGSIREHREQTPLTVSEENTRKRLLGYCRK